MLLLMKKVIVLIENITSFGSCVGLYSPGMRNFRLIGLRQNQSKTRFPDQDSVEPYFCRGLMCDQMRLVF